MTISPRTVPKSLTILEAFCLSLVQRGLRTRYDMQRQGGVSLGSSTPMIGKLVDAGLLSGKHQESDGGRVRQVLTLTAKGKKVLDGAWQGLLSEPATVSVEDVLRVVDMAKHYGAEPSLIAAYLRAAAAAQRSTGARMSWGSTAGIDDDLSIIGTRAAWSSALLRAEADFLKNLAEPKGTAPEKRRKARPPQSLRHDRGVPKG